ncbi:tumor necrosis factor receptor superfamily member 13C [Suncus etruscus]|uniref:tumor necrosis factor receptor superfamily member 13C n=1 Tax=Suncus etruscus TaxID=109475 RepID=UPI0021100E6D|nr:tumor necrosis factor receptor superfamily member 13C [Suncus etruscus]
MRRRAPVARKCLQAQCFDQLVRDCVACELLSTHEPAPAPASPPFHLPRPRTALPPLGPGLPGPTLLLGVPVALGLALALLLVALAAWWRRLGPVAPPTARDTEPEEPLDSVIVLPPEVPEVTDPAWSPPSEDPDTLAPAHSVPVPAIELGSTELVTTKTTGPEPK